MSFEGVENNQIDKTDFFIDLMNNPKELEIAQVDDLNPSNNGKPNERVFYDIDTLVGYKFNAKSVRRKLGAKSYFVLIPIEKGGEKFYRLKLGLAIKTIGNRL